MKRHTDSELCEMIDRRLNMTRTIKSRCGKPKWHELKRNLRILELPSDSIRHIKEDCKERKTARF